MPDPRYRQIADDLRLKIESGALGHGDQLPTELELREEYDASRNTVRDAVKWLITRGLIETRPGQGTFVVGKIDPFVTTLGLETGTGGGEGTAYYASEVEAKRRTAKVSVPRIEIQPGTVAAELRLDDGEMVVSRHQQRFIDGTPWSMQTSFYPMHFVTEGAQRLIEASEIEPGAVKYIEESIGMKQAGWQDEIMVRAPNPTESAFFRLPENGRVLVFEIRRTGFDTNENPLRLTVTVYPADRNRFVMNVGHVPAEVSVPRTTVSEEPDA